MFVKRYLAKDMSEAMDRIRRELGSEAVILSNRAVRSRGFTGLFKKKMVEVMVAYEPAPDKQLLVDPPPREQLTRVSRPYEGKRPNQPSEEEQAAIQQLNDVKRALEALEALETPEVPPPLPPKSPKTEEASDAEPSSPPEEEQAKGQSEEAAKNEAPVSAQNETKIDELNIKLNELKDVVRELTRKIGAVDREGGLHFSPETARIYQSFLRQDMKEPLARRLCEQIQSVTGRVEEAPLHVAKTLLLDILGEPAPLKPKKYQQTVIMLVGPTGVGKTTTLVKLAGMYAVNQGLKVGFINTDTYRVAAQEQLRTYADIMDIPCCTVYGPDEISLALKELEDRDLILIDTAGKSTGDLTYYEEIEAYVKESGTDEVLLAISASMAHCASEQIIRNFSFLNKYKLVITKLDEISVWGNLANIADFAKRPLAYVTVGQNVPQDIEVPDVEKISERLLESVGG